jgi:competence protein ComGC
MKNSITSRLGTFHSKKLTKDYSGYTIVELLIVISIAAAIMLMVFLAVPALQRNSRNTQYKADAASIVSLVTQYASNRSGTLPNCLTTDGSGRVSAGSVSPPVTDDACTNSTGAVTAKISGYTTSVDIQTFNPPCGSGCNASVGAVVVFKDAHCDGNSLGQDGNDSDRQFVALFGLEPQTVSQCLAP